MWTNSHCHCWLLKLLQPLALYLSQFVTTVAKHISTCLLLWHPRSSVISWGASWVNYKAFRNMLQVKREMSLQRSNLNPRLFKLVTRAKLACIVGGYNIQTNACCCPWPVWAELDPHSGVWQSAHLLKYKSYRRGAWVPLRKWGEGRKYVESVYVDSFNSAALLIWVCTQRGIPRMAKVMRRPYPQVCLCQDCGNETPGAIKHHITLHLTPSSGNVSSIPLPVPLLDLNLNLIARNTNTDDRYLCPTLSQPIFA